MKQLRTSVIALSVLCLLSFSASSQHTSSGGKVPKWVSDAGYWVVESNINTPLEHTIWFYNNDNVLVYKEALHGTRLNPSRKSVKMKLKKVLETSVTVWQQKNITEENKEYVAAILK